MSIGLQSPLTPDLENPKSCAVCKSPRPSPSIFNAHNLRQFAFLQISLCNPRNILAKSSCGVWFRTFSPGLLFKCMCPGADELNLTANTRGLLCRISCAAPSHPATSKALPYSVASVKSFSRGFHKWEERQQAMSRRNRRPGGHHLPTCCLGCSS